MYREKIVEHNTGKETFRNYTADEVAEVEKAQQQALSRIENEKQKEVIRQSAFAKLAALGLTEDEIAAL